MEEILVRKKSEKDNEWIFEVKVGKDISTSHRVSVPKDYWRKITKGKINPEEFIRKSFEFLLKREPKESILNEFKLPLIKKYFPEYEGMVLKE